MMDFFLWFIGRWGCKWYRDGDNGARSCLMLAWRQCAAWWRRDIWLETCWKWFFVWMIQVTMNLNSDNKMADNVTSSRVGSGCRGTRAARWSIARSCGEQFRPESSPFQYQVFRLYLTDDVDMFVKETNLYAKQTTEAAWQCAGGLTKDGCFIAWYDTDRQQQKVHCPNAVDGNWVLSGSLQ